MAAAPAARPTLQIILDQALTGTGAAWGWLLSEDNAGLRIAAAAGPPGQVPTVGSIVVPRPTQRYVLASGQPTALMPQPGDGASRGAAGHPDVPPSILLVPCRGPGTVGLLELAAKRNAPSFSFDDMALAAALAAVAGAALGESAGPTDDVTPPAELSAGLERLAATDPHRYARVARAIEALLDRGR